MTMIFAASIGEPPPSAMITSGLKELASSAPLRTTSESQGRLQLRRRLRFQRQPLLHRGDLVCIAVAEQEAVSHDERIACGHQ